MKVHLHDEQFDGSSHAWCGRSNNAVSEPVFEATPQEERCALCSAHWFPFGQPEWHYTHADAKMTKGYVRHRLGKLTNPTK